MDQTVPQINLITADNVGKNQFSKEKHISAERELCWSSPLRTTNFT
jgi:hypothetical protein